MTQTSRSQQTVFVAIIIVAATFWAYYGILGNGFVSFDDVKYLIENDQVAAGLSLNGLRWALTATYDANWFPVTWLSHMADISMFGLSPGGHHFISLLLHIANALLLFWVFIRLTGNVTRSACVALIFALHPLHVESVAWAAERKDVLSTFFFMLTIGAYISYTSKPAASRYLLTLFLYILGLASKPMLVSLPLVLLMLDAWPLGRFCNRQPTQGMASFRNFSLLMYEKIPFFILSAASCVATFIIQSKHAPVNSTAVSPLSGSTMAHAMVNYCHYLVKSFWPSDLAILYPYVQELTLPYVGGAVILLAMTSAWSILQWKQRPYLLIGWVWFLVTLAPVVGFVRIGVHSIADRYTYIPLIGISIMLVWGVADYQQKRVWLRKIVTVSTGMAFIFLATATRTQTGYWKDSSSLFEHTLSVTKNNWAIHNNLAAVQLNNNQNQKALTHIVASLQIVPFNPITHFNLGTYFNSIGDTNNAILAFQKSIALDPSYAAAYYNLSIDQRAVGNLSAANETYQKLKIINPALAQTLDNYNSIMMKQKQAK